MTARTIAAVVGLAVVSACGSTSAPTDSQPAASTSAAGPASTVESDVTTQATSPATTRPPESPGAIDIDPCGLLTADDLAPLLGPVVIPEAEDELPTDALRQCTWFAEDHPDYFIAGISLQVMRRPADVSGAVGAAMMGYQLKPVAGLGEEAYIGIIEPDPDFGIEESVAALVTARGDIAVSLAVIMDVAEGTPEYDVLLDLARTALDRA